MSNKHLHSLRVAYENWLDIDRLHHLLRLLQTYPAGITQIALFTTPVHIPLPLPELNRRAQIMNERMETIRESGFSAGINILTTIGHHCEDLDEGLGERYTYMTNISGEVCRGSYCMRNPDYLREYVVPCYTALAEAKPDFIWVDDDIRYGHMPIGFGCFCDHCIETFNRKMGTVYTREELRDALNRQDVPLRKAWLDHNSEAICGIFRVIGQTVRAIDPDIQLGFMTGERYFEGYQFAAYAEALSENGKYEIMWRPGGGSYVDYCYDEIVKKSEETGRQNAYLPDYVTVVQYELENFPYQLIKKTPVSTALETAWSMTVGCTGGAFNMLPSETGEPIENIEGHLKEIERIQPMYRLLNEKVGGRQPDGISAAWRIDDQAAVPEGEFFTAYGDMYASFAREFFDFGLPQCYVPEKAVVKVLHNNATVHWNDEEIKDLLSGGVYMDAGALDALNKRGFGEYTGFEIEKTVPVDAHECYTGHALNEGIEGGQRNCRQAFNPGDSYALAPTADNAQCLAQLMDYHNRILAECSHGLYENSIGGRICVGGYYPFAWVSDHRKIKQLKRLMIELSGGKLPSYVDSVCRIRNHTFVDGDKCIVTLLNHTNQPLENVRVAVRTEKEEATWYDITGNAHSVPCEKGEQNDGYRFVTVKQIPAYEMVLIEA